MNQKSVAIFSSAKNAKITNGLRDRGHEIFLLPAVNPVPNSLEEREIELISQPLKYDWIVFSDIFSADFLIQRLEANNFDLFQLDAVRICATCESVADRLRFSEIHSDVIAGSIEAAKIFEKLRDYAGQNELANLRFLILKRFQMEFELVNYLTAAESSVETVDIYRFEVEKTYDLPRIKALFAGGAIDEIILSDTGEFLSLLHIVPEILNDPIRNDLIFSAAENSVFQTISEYGLRPAFFTQK